MSEYTRDMSGPAVKNGGTRRSPVHGPGTYNGAVTGAVKYLSRYKDAGGVTVYSHHVGDCRDAVINTWRVSRGNGVEWSYRVKYYAGHGEFGEIVGYTRRQSEALAVAVGKLCRAVDAGHVVDHMVEALERVA